MAKDNSQSSKQSKASSMLQIFKRPSPSPPEQSQGHPSESRSLWKLLSKSPRTTPAQSTSSLPLSSSTVGPHGETALESSIATNPNTHRTSAAISEALQPASFSVVQDEHNSSAQRPTTTTTTTTTALDQSHGEKTVTYCVDQGFTFQDLPQGQPSSPADNGQTASKTGSSTKDVLQVTGRSILTIAKRLPAIVNVNPVKVVLELVKLIIEIQQAVATNMDTVKRRLTSTQAQLETVEEGLRGWEAKTTQENQWVDRFKLTLKEELDKLIQLSEEWLVRKIADHEDEKGRITEIFERINEARVHFELAINIRVFKSVYTMEKSLSKLLLEGLRPSKIANHKYHLESQEEQRVRREICTPGTRVRILDDIVTWAKNTSQDSPNVYWLSGQAGSGKSTIAYTIARRFEFADDPNDTVILGGNFFCSRQFEETRLSKCIVRTLVHHLALKSRPFAEQLSDADLDVVNQNVRAQLEDLLIAPWQASHSARHPDPSKPPQHYLIIIDALDEIDGTGGSDLLRDLLEVIDKNENRLQGLKFFVTSRPDPNLVKHRDALKSKQLYRLEQVPLEEAQDDIRTYLTAHLPHFAGRQEIESLVALAAGLFIYAATIVKYLVKRGHSEQQTFLTTLLGSSNPLNLQPSSNVMPFTLLDTLYLEILNEAFRDFSIEENEWKDRHNILHTFLCTAERTSTSVVADLLFTSDYTDVVEKLFQDLHAVLYCEHGRVLAYHKSFSDFLFTEARSRNFWCDQGKHHRLLAESCFRLMRDGLRFNIANISSSFLLDADNHMLAVTIKENIPPVLSYSSRNWSYHLSTIASTIPECLHDSITDFLQLRALFWIEALNLLGLRGLCSPMLQTAQDWVISSQGSLSLAESLAEARSFALYFSGSGASLSTPHLYISTLATWPRNLDPCRGWKSHFPRIPGFISASLGGTLLMTLKVNSEVEAVAFSPDGRWIVSGSDDSLVRVWDVLTGNELKVLKGHTDLIRSVVFSPDGRQIVSGSYDNSVRVWDVLTGNELKVLEGHTNWVRSAAFSPDGRQIVSGSYDNSVRVWDVSTGNQLKVLKGHTDWVTSVAFSPDGRQIVSGSYDNSVQVWDVLMGNLLKVLKGHTNFVTSVAFSPDGRQIVSGSSDNSVWVWDVLTGNQLKVLKGHISWVNSATFSPDGSQIVSGSYDKSVRVWDVLTGNELKVLKGHTTSVTSVSFSPEGRQIVSGSYTNSVRVWDVLTGDELKVLKGHTNWVTSVSFSPDGRQIVSGSHDKSVRVWDVSMGNELKVLKGHTDCITSATFLSDGGQIISGSDNQSVQVWDSSPLYICETTSNGKYTGWLLSPDGQHRLMFVPPEIQLPDTSNILTIPPSSRSYVNFTNVSFGPQWTECYHP